MHSQKLSRASVKIEGHPPIKAENAGDVKTEDAVGVKTEDLEGVKVEDIKTEGNMDITLVAHYGSGYHHEILARELQKHKMLPAARDLKVCDPLVLFKLMRDGRTSSLNALALELAPKFPTPPKDGVAKALALRAVSLAALAIVSLTPGMVWPRLACPLHAYAARTLSLEPEDFAPTRIYKTDSQEPPSTPAKRMKLSSSP